MKSYYYNTKQPELQYQQFGIFLKVLGRESFGARLTDNAHLDLAGIL